MSDRGRRNSAIGSIAGTALVIVCFGAAIPRVGPRLPKAASATTIAPGRRSSSVCPHDAVFLALEDQIRGYPASANGSTTPCQVIAGSRTMLSTARSLAISNHGTLHVVQFLTDGTYDIFHSYASGNTAPARVVSTGTNDLTAIAVDSKFHDYVLSVRGEPRVLVFPVGASGYQPNPEVVSDARIVAPANIAVDRADYLLIAGYGNDGQAIVDTFDTGTRGGGATLIRKLSGPRTGLFPGGTSYFMATTLSIAVNRSTNELFVFNAAAGASSYVTQVSVFRAEAHGDIAPERVIRGPRTGITGTGILGTNKIAIAADGRLFVAQPHNTILVFAAGAHGDALPWHVITDATAGAGSQEQGGIAVR